MSFKPYPKYKLPGLPVRNQVDQVFHDTIGVSVSQYDVSFSKKKALKTTKKVTQTPENAISKIRPHKPSLVSSCFGKFEEILLCIPNYLVQGGKEDPTDDPEYRKKVAAIFIDAYKALLGEGPSCLPLDCRLILYVHEESYNAVRDQWVSKKRSGNVEYVIVDDDQGFSIWAEDGYCVVNDKDDPQSWFASPWTFLRYADGIIARNIANASTSPRRKDYSTPLIFQGGNCLIGDDFFFIGFDYAIDTLGLVNGGVVTSPDSDEEPYKNPSKIIEQLKQLYKKYLDTDRDLFFIGNFQDNDESKPLPCPEVVTTSITYLNSSSIPESCGLQLYYGNGGGHTLLGKAFPPMDPFTAGVYEPIFHIDMFITLVGYDESKDFIVLVGSPLEAYKIIHDKEVLTEEDYDHPMLKFSQWQIFDNIANYICSMKKRGGKKFKVIRTPLPLVYFEDMNVRTYYYATSNNCLVLNDEASNEKSVWLPTYGYGSWEFLSKTDAKFKTIWESLGFKVHQLPDFHPFAQNLGALHCIKKYIRRSAH